VDIQLSDSIGFKNYEMSVEVRPNKAPYYDEKGSGIAIPEELYVVRPNSSLDVILPPPKDDEGHLISETVKYIGTI
jgi:hypothetical protein